MSRSPASPTWRSAWRWSPRGGSRRRNGRSARPSAPSGPRSSRPPGCGCTTPAGMLEFVSGRHDAALAAFRAAERLAGLARHRAHARPAAAVAHAADAGAAGRDRRVEQALADLDATERDTRRDAQRRGVTAARPGRPDGGGRRARARPRRLGPAAATPICGRSRRSCSRRSPATRSATRAPPGGPWSAPSTAPRPRACSSRSCSTRRPACSTATAGTAPRTPA